VDISRPSSAAAYDYWLGGTNNFGPDREEAERARLAPTPRGYDEYVAVQTVPFRVNDAGEG
jgi:S-adenosyl methyltransferase